MIEEHLSCKMKLNASIAIYQNGLIKWNCILWTFEEEVVKRL